KSLWREVIPAFLTALRILIAPKFISLMNVFLNTNGFGYSSLISSFLLLDIILKKSHKINI
ncbi:hypothetical protein, partial [Escherichia coli]|uniref:hypothetical protein n=1 Tax=Escherichia coli TaxID=562 RepID=UPI001BC84350